MAHCWPPPPPVYFLRIMLLSLLVGFIQNEMAKPESFMSMRSAVCSTWMASLSARVKLRYFWMTPAAYAGHAEPEHEPLRRRVSGTELLSWKWLPFHSPRDS